MKPSTRICIVNSELGNVGSVYNMLKYLGIDCFISSDTKEIFNSSHMILPGVGRFDHGIKSLAHIGIDKNFILDYVFNEKFVLGICLGMQLLCLHSEEGALDGLSLIDASVKRFDFDSSIQLPVPHMGWNTVAPSSQSSLFDGYNSDIRFYFVHSYYVSPSSQNIISGTSDYGKNFCSAFSSGNIHGVQFHPEKSHKFGMHLLSNFSQL